MTDKLEIEIELVKKYRVMVYPYVAETEKVSGREDRYKQYHANSLWEHDDFDHDEYIEIISFLKQLEFKKTQEIEKRQEKEMNEALKEEDTEE